jgi:pyridinium-3,5-bisthiocarboxylic acid mononucleotide nickel chelatase
MTRAGNGAARAAKAGAPRPAMNGELRGQHLHFEPTSGIAGDMTVAALVDAGVPARVVTRAIAGMGVAGLRTRFETRRRGAFVGRGFVVTFPGGGNHANDHVQVHDHDDHDDDHEHEHEHEHEDGRRRRPARGQGLEIGHRHRDYAEIRRLLRRADLAADARKLAGEIFARLAEVEGALHGTPIDRVTFHEVGAFDSIADVVGAAAAIAWLAPASIGSGAPVVGSGQVRTAHGRVMVPAPATAALLRGIPMLSEGVGELTTPTGAAILAVTVDAFGAPPPMRVRAIGYGAGTRELLDRPNVLRVLIGEPLGRAEAAPAVSVMVLEANIDDMSPELVAPLFEAILAAGAVDVWSTPILMKKGRPAITVSALAPPAAVAAVERAFFRDSTTIGVRRYPADRTVLARALVEVDTPYGGVRVKVGAVGGEVIGAQPEFEDCGRRAAATGASVREVMSAAAAAGRALLASPPPGVARQSAMGPAATKRTRRARKRGPARA